MELSFEDFSKIFCSCIQTHMPGLLIFDIIISISFEAVKVHSIYACIWKKGVVVVVVAAKQRLKPWTGKLKLIFYLKWILSREKGIHIYIINTYCAHIHTSTCFSTQHFMLWFLLSSLFIGTIMNIYVMYS